MLIQPVFLTVKILTNLLMMKKPQDFITAYETALATQYWENVAPLVHENCVATFSEGTYKGKAEVEAAYRKTFALIKDETYKISEIHWVQTTESHAIMTYIFNWSGVISGEPASGSGRGTSVLVHEQGKWQLICEHLGPLPQ
jgi:ketosteroid isomerase-like protein